MQSPAAAESLDVYALARNAPLPQVTRRRTSDTRSSSAKKTWTARRAATRPGDWSGVRRLDARAAVPNGTSLVDPAPERELSREDTDVVERYEVAQMVFAAGDPARVVFNSLGREGSTLRSYTVGTETGPLFERTDAAGLHVLDVSADADVVLSRSLNGVRDLGLFDEQVTLNVLSMSGAFAPVEWNHDPMVRPVDGMVLDGSRVVILDEEGRLVLWRVPAGRAEYVVSTEGRGRLIVTPGRRYVGVLEPSRFVFFDPANGSVAGQLEIGEGNGGEVVNAAFDETGERMLVHFRTPRDRLGLWSVGTGVLAWNVPLPEITSDVLQFAEPPHAIVGKYLVDTAVGGVVAEFERDSAELHGRTSPDRRHWVVRNNPNRRRDGNYEVLRPLVVPHPTEAARLAARPPLPDPILGPGSTVSLYFDFTGNPKDPAKFFREAVTGIGGRLRANGMNVAPNQPVTLVVKADHRDTGRTMQYESIGGGPKETLTARVYEARAHVAFVRNGIELWADDWSFANDQIRRSFPKTLRDGESMDVEHEESVWFRAGLHLRTLKIPPLVYDAAIDASLAEVEYEPAAARLRDRPDSSRMSSAPRYSRAAYFETELEGIRDIEVADNTKESFAVVGTDGRIEIWNPKTIKGETAVKHTAAIESAAFDGEGRLLVYGTYDGAVQVYEVSRRRHVRRIKGLGKRITAVLLPDADGPLFAGTFDGDVLCWRDWRNSLEYDTVAKLGSPVVDFGLLPDGSAVVAGLHEKPFVLFDPKTAERIGEFPVPTGPVFGFHFASTGTRVALATKTNGAVVLEYPSGKVVRKILDGSSILAVRFDNDGRHLAVGGRYPGVWRVEDGEPLYSLRSSGRETTSIRYSRDGFGVATGVVDRDDVDLFNLRVPPIGAKPLSTPVVPPR